MSTTYREHALRKAVLLIFLMSLSSETVVAQQFKRVEFVNGGPKPVRVSVYQYSMPPGANVSAALPPAGPPSYANRMRLPLGCYSFCVRWYTGRTDALKQRIYAYSFFGSLPGSPQVCLGQTTSDHVHPRIYVQASRRPVAQGVGVAGSCPTAVLVSGGLSPRIPNEHVANTDCSLLTNSHPVYDKRSKSAYCKCNDGLALKNGRCVARTPPQEPQETAATMPSLAGDYTCHVQCHSGRYGAVTRVVQNGDKLVFVNEGGQRSAGRFLDQSRVVATNWGNLKAAIHNGGQELRWDNKTVWRRR